MPPSLTSAHRADAPDHAEMRSSPSKTHSEFAFTSPARTDLGSVLSWSTGQVRTAFAARVSDVLADLKQWAADPGRSLRIVTDVYERLPNLKTLVGTSLSN